MRIASLGPCKAKPVCPFGSRHQSRPRLPAPSGGPCPPSPAPPSSRSPSRDRSWRSRPRNTEMLSTSGRRSVRKARRGSGFDTSTSKNALKEFLKRPAQVRHREICLAIARTSTLMNHRCVGLGHLSRHGTPHHGHNNGQGAPSGFHRAEFARGLVWSAARGAEERVVALARAYKKSAIHLRHAQGVAGDVSARRSCIPIGVECPGPQNENLARLIAVTFFGHLADGWIVSPCRRRARGAVLWTSAFTGGRRSSRCGIGQSGFLAAWPM